MFPRFAIAVVLAIAATPALLAQESDVMIGSIHDGYTVRACSADGRTLLDRRFPQELTPEHRSYTPQNSHWSLLGVSRDGSITTFELPEGMEPRSAAYDGSDLLVLSMDLHPQTHRPPDPPPGPRYEMLRFDNQANLLTQQQVKIDFGPSQMAVLPSGKTILVGNYRGPGQDEGENVAAVVDTDGQMLKRIPFPLPPQGGGWTFVTYRMAAYENAAYMVLYSYDPPATGIAKISEAGSIEIKIVPAPYDDDKRHHNGWQLGPAVAVEVYHNVGERPLKFRFDEYDLTTGEKIATKSSRSPGIGCYTGSEITTLEPSFHTDPSRHLPPDALRLVFSKLEDLPASPPPPGH